jgi:hypothetical protein
MLTNITLYVSGDEVFQVEAVIQLDSGLKQRDPILNMAIEESWILLPPWSLGLGSSSIHVTGN